MRLDLKLLRKLNELSELGEGKNNKALVMATALELADTASFSRAREIIDLLTMLGIEPQLWDAPMKACLKARCIKAQALSNGASNELDHASKSVHARRARDGMGPTLARVAQPGSHG